MHHQVFAVALITFLHHLQLLEHTKKLYFLISMINYRFLKFLLPTWVKFF